MYCNIFYVLQAMADQWPPKGRVLRGQWSDSGERATLAIDDRSARAGEQVDKKHGEGQRPRGYQVKGFAVCLTVNYDANPL